MKTSFKNRALSATFMLMLIAIFLLPVLSRTDDSMTSSVISNPGAQQTLCTWIMNSVLAALSISSVAAGWDYFEDFMFHRIIMVLFGASLLMAAVFNQVTSASSIHSSSTEAAWHSYFLATSALSFIILTVSSAFILERKRDRVLTVGAAAATLILSLLVSETDSSAGLWQKVIFIIAFGWMVFTFNKKEA